MRTEVNIAGNEALKSTDGVPLISLTDCARHLARLWPTMPLEKRSLVSNLREQIRQWDRGPNKDALRSKIVKSIEAIEGVRT